MSTEKKLSMKLFSIISIAMIHAWQPLKEQWGQATVDNPSRSDHQGKAYMGKAFLDDAREQAEKERATIERPDTFARELLKKMAYTKMILERLKQYKRIELKFLG